MSDTYQLKKIILIDSFWAGKTVLLDLDGHTNLSGTNGAGKTTFLRLMQLFWGERPSNIVGSTGSKKGFLEYYLPRNSSYLIYEYQRPNQQTCHVMIQSDGRSAKYKFIDAPYQEDIYIDENNIPRDSSAIDRHYRAEAETSKLLAVDDYCSIIQCHHVNSAKKWIRPLQRRFAMAHTPITHIEKVIGSVIEKIGDFDSIKQMLIDISREKLSHNLLEHEQDKAPFQLNKQHIDAWLADLNAAREIEAKRDDFDGLLKIVASLKDTLNQLSHIHALALSQHKTTQTELSTCEQSITELTTQRKQLEKDYEQQLEPKHAESRELKKQVADLDYQIQALEEQKQDYEKQDAESFAIKGSLLDQHIQQQGSIRDEIEALESKSTQIKSLYEKQLTDLEHRHSKQLQNFSHQATNEKLNESKSLTEAETVFQQRKKQLSEQCDNRSTPINQKKSQLSIEFGITQASLKAIPVSEALQNQLTQTQQALESVRSENDLAYKTQLKCTTDYSEALTSYQNIERQLQSKKHSLKQTEEQHAQCLKRLSPEPGSLQYFLDNEVEHWPQNIGRVIAPDLLDRKDLSPLHTASSENSIYGLQLDMDILADRDNLSTDKAALTQQEQLLSDQLQKLRFEIEQTTASLAAANKLRESCQTDKNQSEQSLQRISQKKDNLLAEETGLANQIKAEKEKKRVEIEQSINRISQEIADCDVSLANIKEEDEKAQAALHSEHLARKGTIESDTENTLIAINDQTDAENQQFKTEQQRIKQLLKSDLQESGSDTLVIELAEKLKHLKAEENTARKYLRLETEYKNWINKQWQQHASLCQQQSASKQKFLHVEDEIKQLDASYKTKKTATQQQISEQKTIRERTQSLLTQLNNSMDQLKNSPALLSADLPEYAAPTLISLTQTTLQNRKRQEKTLQQGKQVLQQLFTKHHRSQLAETWQQAIEHSNTSSHYIQSESLAIEQPLINVLQMVSNVKQITSQQIDLHATDVNAFYHHLRQFERIIKATGAELSKHISEEHYFSALGEITVKIRSKMNDLEYWQALKNFGDNYEQYKVDVDLSGNTEIPNSLIEAMGELTSMLPSTGISIKHLSLFDIEFSIMENGQIKYARNAKELKDVSSTGLSYLALITFFTGITSMLRKQDQTAVCWPIDELGDLAPENIEAMMAMLTKKNIQILSATPIADRQVLSLFNRRYLLDNQQLHQVNLPESKLDQLLAAGASHV